MMNMRNKLVPFFAVLTAAGLLTGCSGQRADAEKGRWVQVTRVRFRVQKVLIRIFPLPQ